MVKFYGVVFLGQPREEALAHAQDAGRLERLGLAWLAGGCILLGLLPPAVIALLDPVTRLLVDGGIGGAAATYGWWLLAPISEDRASYSPIVFFASMVLLIPLVFYCVRRLFHGRMKRVPPWDCGFPLQTPRMQDSAEGFGQPIRRIFSPFMQRVREHPSPFDRAPRYRSVVEDPFWTLLYQPVVRLVEHGTRLVAFLQQGRIALYLLFSFATLIALLLLTRG